MNQILPNQQNETKENSVIRFAHKWILESFSTFYDEAGWKPSFVYSDNFSPLAREQLDAYLELSPVGNSEKDSCQNFISIFVCLDGSYIDSKLNVNFKVSLLDGNGEMFCCKGNWIYYTDNLS